MRIRSIKPQFFRDSKIIDLPPLARLLYIGLWCCADREGRMEFDPREIRTQVLPEETLKTAEALFIALKASGLIVVYTVQDREYLAIPNFLKHQIPHHREQPSTSPGLAQGEAIPKQVEGRSVSSSLSGELSGERLTTSSNPPPADLDTPARVKPKKRNGADPRTIKLFDAFYADYPRHEGKQAALKAFAKLDPDRELIIRIADDIDRRLDEGQWVPDDPDRIKYIPLPASYLNGKRWEDDAIS
jgi:hypothetical protein